jgi:hypothetical protein
MRSEEEEREGVEEDRERDREGEDRNRERGGRGDGSSPLCEHSGY